VRTKHHSQLERSVISLRTAVEKMQFAVDDIEDLVDGQRFRCDLKVRGRIPVIEIYGPDYLTWNTLPFMEVIKDCLDDDDELLVNKAGPIIKALENAISLIKKRVKEVRPDE